MQVKVERLREVMGMLAPIPPKKPSFPSMNYILFADGKAITTDLENTVFADFPEADEEILINRDALDFLKFVPGDRIAEISSTEKVTTINCGGSQRNWPAVKVGDYPSLRQPVDTHIRLDGDQLLEALLRAMPYVCQDDQRAAFLRGVTVAMDDSGIVVSSGDGFRMFLQKIPGNPLDPMTIVVPASMIKVLKKLWGKESRPDNPAVDALLAQVALSKRLINIGFQRVGAAETQTYMSAQFGKVTLVTHLIKGTPPDWKDLIPDKSNYRLKVFAEDVYLALEQVRGAARESSGIVRFIWKDHTLSVLSYNEEQRAEAECFVTVEAGGDGFIAFNFNYLIEYFKNRQGLVQMCFTEPSKPGLFIDGRFYVVIMPMFVNDQPEADQGGSAEAEKPKPEEQAQVTTPEPKKRTTSKKKTSTKKKTKKS